MVEVKIDDVRFVIDGGKFVEGPVARANEIAEAVELFRSNSLDYVPDIDLFYGEYIEKHLGGKIIKWEPLPYDPSAVY